MDDRFYEDDNVSKKLERIRNSNTGAPINTISIIYIVLAGLALVLFLVAGFSVKDDSILTFTYIAMGVFTATTLYLISVVLKMFYEKHFVTTHLTDIIEAQNCRNDTSSDDNYMECKVCGKKTEINEYGTCRECHETIMQRLENK